MIEISRKEYLATAYQSAIEVKYHTNDMNDGPECPVGYKVSEIHACHKPSGLEITKVFVEIKYDLGD